MVPGPTPPSAAFSPAEAVERQRGHGRLEGRRAAAQRGADERARQAARAGDAGHHGVAVVDAHLPDAVGDEVHHPGDGDHGAAGPRQSPRGVVPGVLSRPPPHRRHARPAGRLAKVAISGGVAADHGGR